MIFDLFFNPLFLILFLNLVAIFHIAFGVGDVRKKALSYSVLIFLVSLFLLVFFDKDIVGYQFNIYGGQLLGISYHLAIDGISIWFIVLTSLLFPFCFLISWESITYRVKEFYILFFIIELLLFNVFSF